MHCIPPREMEGTHISKEKHDTTVTVEGRYALTQQWQKEGDDNSKGKYDTTEKEGMSSIQQRQV